MVLFLIIVTLVMGSMVITTRVVMLVLLLHVHTTACFGLHFLD
jgi:hypothetical protein